LQNGPVLENQVGNFMSKKIIIQVLNNLKIAGINHCSSILVKKTKTSLYLITLLYNEGYLNGFYLKNSSKILVFLKYYNGNCLLKNLLIYGNSLKPKYMTYNQLLQLYKGPYEHKYFLLLNTSYGFLTFEEIFRKNYHIGGEILFSINL
jgi:ribosomal protein S8